MELTKTIDGLQFAGMIRSGAAGLKTQVNIINDLNVFPIPDGDTGDNMLFTILGGANAIGSGTYSLAETARRAADGMLLGARGNSGVILSQFFDGIAEGLKGAETADGTLLGSAFRCGVTHAYSAVVEPTEGTMLTVAREAADAACKKGSVDPETMIADFIGEAKQSLERTPELLPVLKKAGVVDSGGAGLICIMEGMLKGLAGDTSLYTDTDMPVSSAASLDLSLFDENSELTYGYCTELLVRLQNAKTNPETFDIGIIKDYLQMIGDSVVAFKTDSIVKIHVHTMTPDKVLAFCQQYGEFLTVKIENMSLQHNNTVASDDASSDADDCTDERKSYGIVAVCAGEGVKNFFTERGADVIVDGGQSMNPSTEDFLKAFRAVNADTILVLPNNGNIILAAKQAAALYTDADVRIIESKTIGDGYAALSMLDIDSGDTDAIVEELTDAMQGVATVEVSRSIRDTSDTTAGEYIGFIGKDILCSHADRLDAAMEALDKAGIGMRDICILIYGKEVDEDEAETLESRITKQYPNKEVYVIDGRQEIYDYILILE